MVRTPDKKLRLDVYKILGRIASRKGNTAISNFMTIKNENDYFFFLVRKGVRSKCTW
jgi:hypothetical protein